MERQKKPIIGILGGMGPEATSLFFQKVIQYTPADKDQGHLKIVIFNSPEIPDRTDAIVYKRESPVEKAKEGMRFLQNAKVDFIVIPCVTIHYFFDEIISSLKIPVLNIIEETALFIKQKYPEIKRAGILATKGTFHGRIFEKVLHAKGLITIVPDEKGQEKLMDSIYGKEGIKAGYTDGCSKELIMDVAADLIKKGADVVIGGCTEIPIAVGKDDLAVPFIDSLSVLARATVDKAGMTPKK